MTCYFKGNAGAKEGDKKGGKNALSVEKKNGNMLSSQTAQVSQIDVF